MQSVVNSEFVELLSLLVATPSVSGSESGKIGRAHV